MAKYDIEVDLSKVDGNAYGVLAAVDRALRKAGAPQSDRDEYQREAKSGDYDHLIDTTMKYVGIE